MSLIPQGTGGGGKPYKGDNPLVPTTTEQTIDKGTLITEPLVISAVEDVTPEVQAQSPLVTEILESLVGKVTLANATPETILEGYSAYVGQELVTGILKLMEKNIGFSEVAYGTITLASNSRNVTVNPQFKERPRLVFCFTDVFNYADRTVTTDDDFPVAVVTMRYDKTSNSSTEFICKKGRTATYSNANLLDADKVYIAYQATLKANIAYTWIAMA